MRALGPDFDPKVVAAIDEQLQSVAGQHVTILWAVESGSRAWGFPSPDSDYDCRFIYMRRPEDYLSLTPPRDVIEFPPDDVLDVNGWDLGKALRLMLKGNAVVIEWLTSPHVYAGDPTFRGEALALATAVARPESIARHYLHLGDRQRRTYFSDTRSIVMKKIFYALRPAVALRWLRLHPGQPIAPMHFPTLVAQSNLDAETGSIIADLLLRKAATRELGRGPLPPPIGALIDSEYALAADFWDAKHSHPNEIGLHAADALFRRWVIGTR